MEVRRGVITYTLWRILGRHSSAVEQKPAAGERLALAVAEGVHQLLQLRRLLDLEEHLVVVVRHLDVEVLGRALLLVLLRCSLV